jgi:hypothetical protein
MWESALTRVDVAVGVIAVLGGLKSAYNGHVRRLVKNIYMVGEVKEQVDNIEERQEKLINSVVALSVAESKDDVTVDTDRLEKNLRGQSYRLYLQRDGHRNPYTDTEDEEETTRQPPGPHRAAELGEEVSEP